MLKLSFKLPKHWQFQNIASHSANNSATERLDHRQQLSLNDLSFEHQISKHAFFFLLISLETSLSYQQKALTTLDRHLAKIKLTSIQSIPFIKSFEEISENAGIAFLFFDPSESHLQLLHHGTIFGWNWNEPSKQVAAIIGLDFQAKPIQIIQKSIKNIKKNHFLLKILLLF